MWPGKANHTPFHTPPGPSHQAKVPKRSSSSKFQCCDKDKSIYTPQNFKIGFQAVLFYSIFWWFATELHSLMRAWAGVLLFIVVYFTTSPAWQKSAQKPEDLLPRLENKTKIKTHSMSKMVAAAFNLLINQSRDWCLTVEGARKSMFDWRICEGTVMLKGAAPALSIRPGAWQTDFQSCVWRERGRPKLETWISFL